MIFYKIIFVAILINYSKIKFMLSTFIFDAEYKVLPIGILNNLTTILLDEDKPLTNILSYNEDTLLW